MKRLKLKHHFFKTLLTVEVEVEFVFLKGRYATLENPAESSEYDIHKINIVCDDKLTDSIEHAISHDKELKEELDFLCAEYIGKQHAAEEAEREYYNPKKGEIV